MSSNKELVIETSFFHDAQMTHNRLASAVNTNMVKIYLFILFANPAVRTFKQKYQTKIFKNSIKQITILVQCSQFDNIFYVFKRIGKRLYLAKTMYF